MSIPSDPLQTEEQFQEILAAAYITYEVPPEQLASLRRKLLGLSVAEIKAAPRLLHLLLVAIGDVHHLAAGKPGLGMFAVQWHKGNCEERAWLYQWAALEGTPSYEERHGS